MFKSIRRQLILLAAVPVIGLVAVSSLAIYEKFALAERSKIMIPLTHIAEAAENVIHELQIERGTSVSLISSGYDEAISERVAAARANSDQALTGLAKRLEAFELESQAIHNEFLAFKKDVKLIPELREKIDTKNAQPSEVVKKYTGVVKDLLQLIGHSIEKSPIETVTAEMLPFFNLVEAKEAGGLERALGAQIIFAADNNSLQFKPNLYIQYMEKLSMEKAYLEEFLTLASDEHKALFEPILSEPAVQQLAEWRETVTMLQSTLNTKGINPTEYFDVATERLNLIRGVSTQFIHNAEAEAEKAVQAIWHDVYVISGIVVAAMVVTILVVTFQLRSITGVTSGLSGAIGKLANGQLDVEVPYQERADELGEIARSARVFRENAIERKKMQEAEEARNQASAERQTRIDGLITDFRTSVTGRLEGVDQNTAEMADNANMLSGIASDTEAKATDSSDQSNQASTSVQTVAAASEELSASIQEIAQQVATTTAVVGQATTISSEANTKISSLADAAQRIGNVVSLIQDIAEQTNLLALNATIEAARAGEAGRGFAVVASEVKELASQTAKATEEISHQVNGIQGATGEAVNSIQMIEKTMTEVSEYANAIAAAVEEQGSATAEISQNAQLASSGTTAAANNLSGMRDAAGETSQSANHVLNATQSVREQSRALREEIDRFLADVAAA